MKYWSKEEDVNEPDKTAQAVFIVWIMILIVLASDYMG